MRATADDAATDATQRFRYVRLAITRRQYPTQTNNSGKLSGNGLALSEFRLTLGGEPVAWDGATLDAEEVDKVDNTNCGPEKIMDGSIGLNNKWFYQNDATEDLAIDPPFTFDFDAGEGKDFDFDGYQLATADVAYRNPPAWAVYGSDDGTAWTLLDTRSYTDADARVLGTYTWQTFSLNMAALEPTGRSINLNVANGTNTYTANLSGDTASGLVPVPNSRWLQFSGDNVSAGSLSETITNAKDSYGNATTASITANMGGAGSFYALWNAIGSAREGRIGLMGHGYREPTAEAYGTDLTLKDIPYPRYDLLLYFGTDVAGKKFNTVAIKPLGADNSKRVTYSYPENATGDAAVASGAWGSSDASRTDAGKTATLGTDVMRIRNLSGDIEVDVGEYKTTNDRGGLCGFQIVYAGELRKAGALNLNFVGSIGDSGVVQANETLHGLYPAPGTSWINLEGASGTDVAIANAYETALSGRPTVSYASKAPIQQGKTQVTILRGCIEEGNVTVENVPYEMYDVIVYMTTSSYGMAPVMVNGAYYTWEQDLDNTSDPGHTILSHAHGPKWGPGAGYGDIDTATAPEYGVSALRINAQTAKTLTVRPQLKQGHWVGTQSALAAIQIVERIKVPVDGTMSWADATAGIDPSAPIYIDFGPNGHITDSSVTLPENAIVDFEESDLSKGDLAERPFAGELVTNTSTELRLPSNVGQYSDAQVTYYTANIAGSLKTPNGGTNHWVDDYPIITIDGIDDLMVSYNGSALLWITSSWQDRVWTGAAGDGDWNNPENWLLGKLPTEASNVLIPVKDGEEVFINIPEGAGTVANVTITGQGDSGLVSVTGKFPVADTGKVTVEGKVTIDGSAFAEEAIAIDGDVTLGAGVRPLPVITKGDASDPYGTVTIRPTSEEALKGGTVTIPAGSGLAAGDIAVEGIDKGAVTVMDKGNGSYEVTWKVLPATLSINFGSNVKEIPDETTKYGVFPVAGTEWVDLANASGETTVSDFGSAVKPVVAYTSRGVGVRPTNIDPILSGSLDTADITVENVPYEKYDVIVYYATSYKNGVFPPVKINGTYYTWDEALQTGYPTTVDGPSFGQGGTAQAALGVNAIRIDGLSGDTLTLVSQKSFNAGGKYHRGCIAGVQIIRRAVVTVDGPISADDLTAKLPADGSPVKVEVLPGGSVSGNLDLSDKDVVIDLTDFDFSMGDKPFAGDLTVDGDTTLLLPNSPDQYQPNENGTVAAPVADNIAGTPAIDAPGETAISGGTVTVGTADDPATFPNEWTGGAGDGDWVNPDNWSQGVVPGAGDAVVIPVDAGGTVTIPEGTQIGDLTIAGDGTVAIGGGTTIDGNLVIDGVAVDVPTGTVTVGGSTTIQNGGALNVGDGQGDKDATFNTGTLTKPEDGFNVPGGTVTVKPDGTLNVGTVDEAGTVTGGTIDLPDAGYDVAVDGGSITVNGGTTDDTVVNVTGGSTVTGPATGEGTVNVSGATEGEGAITVGGNVGLGETRPTVNVPADGNASITVTPTGDEAIKGEITLPGGFTENNTPIVNVPGVSGGVSTAVDENGDLVITWTPDYPTLDKTAGWADGDKWSTSEGPLTSAPTEGIVVVDGETNGPITVTLPEGGIAEGITQVIVKGDVTFVGDALPPEVTPAPGATVIIGGTTLPEDWEQPEGTTLVVTEPNDSLAGATLEGEVILDFASGTEADLTGADFPGGLEIKGEDVTVTVDDFADTVVTVTGDVTLAGTDGIAPGFGDNGAATIGPDATLTLDPETNWAGATVTATGDGTLDTGGVRPTLDGAGEQNALPSTIVITATEEELRNGTVTIPVTPGTTLPEGAQIVVKDEDGNHVATVGGTIADDTLTVTVAVMKPLPGGNDAAVSDAIKDAIVADALGNGIAGPFDVTLTPNGTPAADLDGAMLNEALAVFEELTPTVSTDGEGNTTLNYAFWFGIGRFAIEEKDGKDVWVITVQAMDANAENKPARIAAGSVHTFRANDGTGEQPLQAESADETRRESGIVTLRVPAPEGAADRTTVKAFIAPPDSAR